MSINGAENATCAPLRRRELAGCEESDNNSSNTNESSYGSLRKFGKEVRASRRRLDLVSTEPTLFLNSRVSETTGQNPKRTVHSESSGTHSRIQNGKSADSGPFRVLSECAAGAPGHGPWNCLLGPEMNGLKNPLLYSNSQINSLLKRQRKLLPKKS